MLSNLSFSWALCSLTTAGRFVPGPPGAPGLYRPELTGDPAAPGRARWGICHGQAQGDVFLRRFAFDVPGATGYLDTNYIGKAKYALKALRKHDVVFIHVESPDEAGHEGNIKHKLRAIEDFDRQVVGTILKGVAKLKSAVRILSSSLVLKHSPDGSNLHWSCGNL